MRNAIKILAALGLLAMVAGVAAAAGLTISLKANIPFQFEVAGQTLPAGQYYVERGNHPSAVVFRDAERRPRLSVLTSGLISRRDGGQAVLVFDRYDNRYFLRQVWEDGRQAGVQMPRSGAERALMAGRPDRVEVAATYK